jgi:hypothetical protein
LADLVDEAEAPQVEDDVRGALAVEHRDEPVEGVSCPSIELADQPHEHVTAFAVGFDLERPVLRKLMACPTPPRKSPETVSPYEVFVLERHETSFRPLRPPACRLASQLR